MPYSPSDIYQALVNAGVPASDAGTLTQISGAESGYGANQIGAVNRNGTTDYGLFQVNSGAWPQLNPTSLVNAPLATQANAAATVYNQQGLGAWSTYNSGAYRNFSSGAPVNTQAPPSGGSTGLFGNGQGWFGTDIGAPPPGTPPPGTPEGDAATGSKLPGGGKPGSLAAPAGAVFKQFTDWLASIASRAGLFVLAILFILGALVLFGIKSGIEIETRAA